MSDSDSELNGVTNAMEAADLAGEFKLRALNNNKLNRTSYNGDGEEEAAPSLSGGAT